MYNILHPSYIKEFGVVLTEKQAVDLFGESLQKLVDKGYIAYANDTTKNIRTNNKSKPKFN